MKKSLVVVAYSLCAPVSLAWASDQSSNINAPDTLAIVVVDALETPAEQPAAKIQTIAENADVADAGDATPEVDIDATQAGATRETADPDINAIQKGAAEKGAAPTGATTLENTSPAEPEPSHALTLMIIKNLKAPVGWPKASDDDFWKRDYLTGNWGGKRDELHNKGLDFAFAYFLEYYNNVSGGLHEGGAIQNVGVVSFDLYSTKDGIFRSRPGQQFHLTTSYLGGDSLRSRVGSLNPIVNTDAVDAFRLFELWYGRKFDNNTKEIRIGRILPYVQIGTSRSAHILENGSFNYPTFLGFGVGGTYLAAPFGVQLRVNPKPRLTILAQIQDGYDDPSGGFDNRYGLKLGLNSTEGFEGTLEAAYRSNQLKGSGGMPGTFRLGLQFHTAKFRDKFLNTNGQSLALAGGQAEEHRGNYSAYFSAEQMLKRESSDPAKKRQGLTGFVRGVALPQDINTVSYNAATGLSYEGLIPGRDRDVSAIGYSYTRLGSGVRNFARDQQTLDPTVTVPDAERVLEIQYSAEIAPWWVVKLDMQRVMHPSGSRAIPNATVFGVSTRFAF